MKHTKGKKIGLMIFMLTIFAVIPITSVIAEAVKVGDPAIEYVSSKLRVPEEIQKLSVNETVTDAIYYLDVELQATRRMAAYVNGILSFKENLRDYGMESGIRLNRNLSITKDFSVWTSLSVDETKTTTTPFVIIGLNSIPEKMVFVLELNSTNPHDEKTYSETIEFTVLTSLTTIDITTIMSPSDQYKGIQVPINIYIKNTGPYATSGYVTAYVRVTSIKAGQTNDPFENTNGAIVLEDIKTFSLTINPNQIKSVYFKIDYSGYSNGAMNIGEWKISKVYVDTGNAWDDVDEDYASFNQHISDPYYEVLNRPKSMQAHPVFMYYLWNSGGGGSTWGGTNPKPWIVDGNGDGDVSAGLSRFLTSASNIPVVFNMIFCYDDSSWNIPYYYEEAHDMFAHGEDYVGTQLGIVGGEWIESGLYLSIYNCGFDILLMAAGREASDAMGLAQVNRAIVCKSGASTSQLYWKRNIDGVAQHEVSHLFGCEDKVDGHPRIACIMYYSDTWPWLDFLHEKSILPWAQQYPYWCSECQAFFDTRWSRFSTVN